MIAVLKLLDPKNLKFIVITVAVIGVIYVLWAWYSAVEDKAKLENQVTETVAALTQANKETAKTNATNTELTERINRNKANQEAKAKADHKLRLKQQKREEKDNAIFNNLTDVYSQLHFARGMCEAITTINNDGAGFAGCGEVRIATKTNLETGEWLVFNKNEVGVLLENYNKLADYFKELDNTEHHKASFTE